MAGFYDYIRWFGGLWNVSEFVDISRRNEIRAAVKYGLEQITTDNGYNTTIHGINFDARGAESILEFPAVNLRVGREEYLNAISGGHSFGRLMKNITIYFDVFCQDINTVWIEKNKVIADIEKYFMNNWYLNDADNRKRAINLLFGESIVWGIKDSEPYGGFTVPLTITYTQNILNPADNSMATTAPTPPTDKVSPTISVRESLREAVLYNLRQIVEGSTYNMTLRTDENVSSIEQILEFPFVNVREIGETNQGLDDTGMQDRLLHKIRHYEVDVYVQNIEIVYDDQDRILADIEKRFMNNPTFPNEDDKKTCLECMFNYNEPFGIESTDPLGGITIGFDVFYRQDIYDPTNLN